MIRGVGVSNGFEGHLAYLAAGAAANELTRRLMNDLGAPKRQVETSWISAGFRSTKFD